MTKKKVTIGGDLLEYERPPTLAYLKATERGIISVLLDEASRKQGVEKIRTVDIKQGEGQIAIFLEMESREVRVIEAKLHTCLECMDLVHLSKVFPGT